MLLYLKKNNNVYLKFKDYLCIESNTIKTFNGNFYQCKNWFANNALLLNIWYDSLSIVKRSQKRSYSVILINIFIKKFF